jgi:hypothetical protein
MADQGLVEEARREVIRLAELDDDMSMLTEKKENIEHQHALYRVSKRGYSWYRELEALRGTLYVMSLTRLHWQRKLDRLREEIVRRGLASSSDIHRLIG